MMKKYEVVASRHDVSPHVVASQEFNNDEAAKKWFREEVVHRPNLGYDWLRLVRVDQERVEVEIDSKH